ncbi:unnamed protein product [Schistosoma curassoni]|uniref:ABC transporter n=1 Tax=Schistosoma curassoni TaxID=6186 RepID=A0A183JQT2_9TREM|nr:unnamed protein product [Schistosoma curassoni]
MYIYFVIIYGILTLILNLLVIYRHQINKSTLL